MQRGQLATLRCHYDTEEAPLYSVKWYRGRHEFYRYSPSELPNNKIFPFGEIHVDVSINLIAHFSKIVLIGKSDVDMNRNFVISILQFYDILISEKNLLCISALKFHCNIHVMRCYVLLEY